jgi:aminopeptidase-like protein
LNEPTRIQPANRASLLDRYQAVADCLPVAEEIASLAARLMPICRSITGQGVQDTLDILGERIPIERTHVPSGTAVLDWEVPKEWNVREAYILDPQGRRVVDFREHTLHLVSYSIPVRRKMSLAELRPHLHSLPDHPDWIPYRTSYYSETWGFCLKHSVLESLQEGEYEVVIDTTLAPGSLTYGECVLPGETNREVVLFTHICHPSLANDNVSGMSLVSVLAQALSREPHRFTYRIVFAPATIGSITWLARNEAALERIDFGLVIGLVGDPGALTYKCSRRGDTGIDDAARHVVPQLDPAARIHDFSPYGYDERQFCSPGFDLAFGRLTRSANSCYPQYHTSADNLELMRPQSFAESFLAIVQILRVLEGNVRYRNLSPRGEPRLGKRGLYRKTGGTDLGRTENAYLWLLNQSDGGRDLLSIANRAQLPFDFIRNAALDLERAGLLAEVHESATQSPSRRGIRS